MMARLIYMLSLVMAGFSAIAQDTQNGFEIDSNEVARMDSAIKVKSDSLDQAFKNQQSKLDSIEGQVTAYYQSIRNPRALDSVKLSIAARRSQLDSAQASYKTKLKALSSLKLPPGKLNQRIDSLNRKQRESLSKVTGKVNELESGMRDKWQSRKNSLATKFKPVKDSLGVNLPLKEPGMNIPGVEGKPLEQLDVAQLDAGSEIPKAGTDALGVPSMQLDDPLKDLTDPLKEVTAPIKNIAEAPKTEFQKLQEIDEVRDVKEGLAEVNTIKGEVGEYKEEIAALKEGGNAEKLSKRAEEQAKKVGELNELNKHEKKLLALREEREKQIKLVEQYKDKDFIRKQLKDKTQSVANEQLINKNEKVKDAMSQLGKHKKKYSEIQSINDLPKRPPNPMKGKPLRERLSPGMVFQIQKIDILSVFISPQINYRLSKRWSTGVGGLVRLRGTVNDSLRYISGNLVYGYKAFVNYTAFKGFAIRAEWEPLKVHLPIDDISTPPYSKWVSGYFVGLDKGFAVNRRWKGDMQVLFNFGYKKEETPYANRINFRFGFFLDLRKKQKLPGM